MFIEENISISNIILAHQQIFNRGIPAVNVTLPGGHIVLHCATRLRTNTPSEF
jgi:hypothetical protein